MLVYDLGNGLTIERGGEIVEQVAGRATRLEQPDARAAQPPPQWIGRTTCATSATCARSASGDEEHVAVIVRGVDQIVPAERSGDFEHGSITSMLRAWACESPFADLPFTSLLIADNLQRRRAADRVQSAPATRIARAAAGRAALERRRWRRSCADQ